ncbi:MerR family transcriptional regulator [Aduncisulcus paluster]|uniref:MerR family transcriptional regulator n=1 Tax=Aduncisulcus paluster TaxID=2918883 RepID=A0ABQ5KHI4_9EUKA|nr:MerR family transcriptional regulator [Aduncisulcus paluster]
MHRTLLEKEKRRLARLLKTIDRCIDEAQGGDMVIMKDKFDGLSKAELEAYKEEAKAKWGVQIVEASEKRLRDKGLDNPEVLQEQLEDIFTRTAAVEDKAVQKLMEELRSYMNQFYDCSDEMFRGLGQMYVEDERFHKNISKFGTGLPEFLAKAMAYSTENS